jgi:hypothetical protein
MVTERLNRPPTQRVEKVLQDYYNNLDKMDRIDALCIYRNTMGRLYKIYNPYLRIRYWSRDDFLPKEDDYEE